MIALSSYVHIKNKYCICYLGNCNDYLVQLLYLRPHIEQQLSGIELYICYRDASSYLVQGYERIVNANEIEEKKKEFAHLRVLECNLQTHPVWDLLTESDLKIPRFPTIKSQTTKCVIYPKGFIPTRSLTPNETEMIKSKYTKAGWQVQIEGSPDGAGLVIGVENEQLFRAAFTGVKTALVPTGVGTELYSHLFGGEILTLPHI